MLAIKMHSFVDVITNSSTTIYTFSEGCITPFKEMIEELGRTLGFSEKADDMFYIGVFPDVGRLTDIVYDNEIEGLYVRGAKFADLRAIGENVEAFIEKILRGEVEKPSWMEVNDDYENYCDTTLYLEPKDEKYAPLAKAITSFLYSTQHKEGYN